MLQDELSQILHNYFIFVGRKTDNDFLISQNTLPDLNGPKENIICTMNDVRGDVLVPLHGTTPAVVITNKHR